MTTPSGESKLHKARSTQDSSNKNNPSDDHKHQTTLICCSAIHKSAESARLRREKRMNRPQPWVILKMTIAVAVALIGFATYVFIGRVCVPRIQRTAQRNVPEGIALLVVYAILLMMVLWSYLVVVITPPGKASDHVPEVPRPVPIYIPPTSTQAFYSSGPYRASHGDDDTLPGRASNDAASHKPTHDTTNSLHHPLKSSPSRISEPRTSEPGTSSTHPPSHLVAPRSSRRPPTTPILLPEWRYCSRESIIKPYRAHHCRACGTCILKYDHHCPWIGQCVGARNHKFFIIFNFWGALFTMYTLGALIGVVVKEGSENLDPPTIVIIALCGLFFLFTASLYMTHVRLACLNQTTVESLAFRDMKERENEQRSWKFWDRSEKHLADEEWGRMNKEGNLWWKDGGWKVNFEETMGTNRLGWFLPIEKPPLNGLSYTPNPRFDEFGRWRRRAEWPVELQKL